jgi:hypothetical protein
MAHGAAMLAANISQSIELKPIWLQDINPIDIQKDCHLRGQSDGNITDLFPTGVETG